MDPKKKQLLTSTSQSFEKFSYLLGINLSSYIGRLYGLALVILFIFLSQTSWQYIFTFYENFTMRFMLTLWFFITTLFLLIIMCTYLFRPKQFIFPHQEIFIIDSILESYGVRFTDKDIFFAKHLQDIVIAIIVFLDVMNSIYNIIDNFNSFQRIYYLLFSWYYRMCNIIINGLFGHYINDIYLRFREMNKIMTQHSRENLSVSYTDFTASSNLFNKCNNAIIKIRSIQYIHHGLYILAIKINTNFGLYLLIISITSFIDTIALLYNICHNPGLNDRIKIKTLIDIIYLISFYTLQFFYISYICQRSKNEFRQMAIILHDAFLEYKSLRAELIHENLTFTASGLYEINIPLMCSIAGATITYCVILIQFDTKFKSL